MFAGLCEFEFAGAAGEGVVTRDKDGDTLCLGLRVTHRELLAPRKHGLGKGHQEAALATNSPDASFLTVLPLRILGMDAAAHAPLQGAVAPHVLTEQLARTANRVFYRIVKHDKFGGREDAHLWLDRVDGDLPITQLLLRKEWHGPPGCELPRHCRVLALPYGGEAKSGYMKGLPTLHKREIDAWVAQFRATTSASFSSFLRDSA